MTLRPRYSLLTLLVLTALVAGGIKFWRGPHWRTMSDPPSADQQRFLNEFLAVPDYRQSAKVQTEYQFLNTFDGQRLLLIKCVPVATDCWFVSTWKTLTKQAEAKFQDTHVILFRNAQ